MAKHCATMPLVAYDNKNKLLQKGNTVALFPPDPEENHKKGEPRPANLGRAIHDFRSSLNIIMGNSELMLEDVMGKVTDEQRDSLKDILSNSQHLVDIIHDIEIWQTPARR